MKFIHFVSNPMHKGLGQPIPAKKYLPEWFKNAESFYVDSTSPGNQEMPGLKECKPYMDMMITGYYLVWPCDVHIKSNQDGTVEFGWDEELHRDFIAERPKEMGATMPRPYGFAPNHLVFSGMWGWKTPKGYSTIVTHPINQVELPFYTVSAVVDSDVFNGAGNIPFFVRENWNGTIKKGTPFAQIIPIKRDRWKIVDNDQGLIEKLEFDAGVVRDNNRAYKKTMWFRKDYS
jgi:hypothetical protein